MNQRFTRRLNVLLVVLACLFGQSVLAQTGVLNPNDPIVIYNSANPPTLPPAGTLAKWVKTTRMSYNTDDFKCYIYNYVPFRLKWPKTWTPGDTKTYPLYVFFHGVGEGGGGKFTDNEFQMAHGGDVHQKAVNNGTFDGFLLYPQSPATSGGWSQQQLDGIADFITNHLIPEMRVDPFRINVNGLSGGGDATWEFAETHPSLFAGVLPMSAANISDINYVNLLKFTPIWLFQGGLDKAPDPSTTIQLVNAYNNAGGNLKYQVFPNDGHNTWDDAWKQTDYFPFMLRAYQSNPWVLTGKNQFCPGETINATIGVVGGLDGYQWRKDGVIIPGASSNTITATATGTYDCQVLHGSTWSQWSPIPAVIGIKQPTVPPTITLSGLASNVLPAPDGNTSVNLMVPANFTSYVWKRVDSPATLESTANVLTGATPGQYAVQVTEQFGCASALSNPYTVISANGPNPPSAPVNLLATTMSKTQIKLTWGEGGGNPETQFEVYQSQSQDGPYQLVGFTAANVDSFVISNLTPKTTYFYEVRAINATAGSPVAGPSSSQTQADITAPTAPNNLHIIDLGPTSVQLAWDTSTDNVAVTAYDIYINGNKAYTIGNVKTYTVPTLVQGQTYTFAIRAKDFAGNISPYSNQVAGVPQFTGLNYSYYTGSWTKLPDFNALTPAAIGNVNNVSLTNALSTTNYGFKWTGYIYAPVTGTYTFETSSDDGSKLYIDVPYSVNASANVNNDNVHATTTVAGSSMTLTKGAHTITITFFQGTGGSAMSVLWKNPQTNNKFVAIPDSAFTQGLVPSGTVPVAPSNLVATTASAKKINLTSYGDSSLNASTTYYYKIQSINNSGSSKFNNQGAPGLTYAVYTNYTASSISAIATSTPSSTGTVSNFSTSVTSQTTKFALQFNGSILIPTTGSYTFYSNSGDGSNLLIDGNQIVSNDGVHNTQEKSGVVALTAGFHTIRVNFFQQTGSFALTTSWAGPGISKSVIPDSVLVIPPTSATTQALPAVPADPSGLSGTAQGPTHASLSWTNNDANVTGFEVWRSPGTNTNYVLAATTPVITSFMDSGLLNNTQYFYKVRAINEGGVSNYSNEISLTTSSSAVTTVTLTPVPNQALVNDTTVVVGLSASSSSAGAAITWSSSGLPSFATLADNHDGTASLTMTTNSSSLGAYKNVILTATDAFGGNTSDTLSITVSGRNVNTVQVSFNTNNSPVSTPGWNGMNISGAVNGASATNFVDVNGAATTEGITITSNYDGAYPAGMNTGNNSGIFPDDVLKNFYFGSTFNTYSFKVTGLSSNKKYSLILFAGYPWSASDVATYGNLTANYTVGSQTIPMNAANNISNTIQFAGLSPDASGTITVSMAKPLGCAYVLINDLQILSYDAPATASALLPPTNLVANGLSSSSIGLTWVNSSDARTGLQIWRSTSPTGAFSQLATVAANATSYTDASLPANSTYFYEVREAVSGGQFSGYSNIAGGSTVQYTVNISLNSQAAGSQPAPWNDINTLMDNGFSLNNLTDMNNNATGINFNLTRPFTSFNDQLGVTTGNNSGVVPDAVMKTFYYNSQGDTATVSITGLSRTQVYNFGFYAGTVFNNSPTIGIYQIGNKIVSLSAYNNTTNMVFIYGVKPDSTGTVNISFYTDITTAYAMWSSLTIQGMPSPDVIAADSAGTAGTIATRLSNNGTTATANSLQLSGANQQLAGGAIGAYPNPFVDNVVVSLNLTQAAGKFTLVVVDAAGRIMQKQEFSGVPAGMWQQTLNFSGLTKGIYFIQVYGLPDGKTRSFQMVKVN
jgi:predicted esterase